jgi:cardiolipin synthase (CMP-forming)
VSEPILTVANQLTILRMALAPLLVVLVVFRELQWALWVFVVAGLTDLFDGYVARHGSQQTTLGAMLDPVADKILLSSAFIALTWSSNLPVNIPVWLTVTTLSRDAIIVISVAIVNLTLGKRIFYPSLLGKLSTASQIITVGLVLLVNALGTPHPLLRAVFWISLALTVSSAFHYVYLASAGRSGTPAPPPGAAHP